VIQLFMQAAMVLSANRRKQKQIKNSTQINVFLRHVGIMGNTCEKFHGSSPGGHNLYLQEKRREGKWQGR